MGSQEVKAPFSVLPPLHGFKANITLSASCQSCSVMATNLIKYLPCPRLDFPQQHHLWPQESQNLTIPPISPLPLHLIPGSWDKTVCILGCFSSHSSSIVFEQTAEIKIIVPFCFIKNPTWGHMISYFINFLLYLNVSSKIM